MFDRYSTAAQSAVARAAEVAKDLGHAHIGSEHLAVALLGPEDTGAAKLLVGVSLPSILGLISEAIDDDGSPELSTPRPNSEFRTVVERAFREGLGLGHGYIATEDLLLGILADRHNLGQRILTQLGVDYNVVRRKVGQNWERSLGGELEDDLTHLTKENAALRAAIAEMRPVFDAAVRDARHSKSSRREWGQHTAVRIGAGEFGEPRKVG